MKHPCPQFQLMGPRGRRLPLASFLLISSAALTLLGAVGCRKAHEEPDISQLKITRYRLNLDDAHDIARIMAEVTNYGEQPVEKVQVTAALKGPGEEDYESNTTIIQSIAPGHSKVFSITIDDIKGKERDVEFTMSLADEEQ